MGIHTGIRIRDLWAAGKFGQKRWSIAARDPLRRTYKTKRFADGDKAAGIEWAKRYAARFRCDLDRAGTLTLAELASEYDAHLAFKRRSQYHRDQVQLVAGAAVAAGITNLLDPRLVALTEQWLIAKRNAHPVLAKHDARVQAQAERDGRFVAAPDRTIGDGTRLRYVRTLRAIGNFARKRGYVARNPFLALETSATTVQELKPVFAIDELAELVSFRHAHHPWWFRVCRWVFTGTRPGEGMHLRWEWHDREDERIELRSTTEYPIKRKRERIIPILSDYQAVLDHWQKQHGTQRFGWLEAETAVREGDPGNWVYHFERYVTQECKLPLAGRTPYSLRHNWISLMLATGEHETLVQGYAGHDDLETTAGYATSQSRFRTRVAKLGWGRGQFKLLELAASLAAPSGEAASAG